MAITPEILPNPGILRDVQILVVDGDRDNRDLYAFLLESYGAKVTTIASIKDALDWLYGHIPNLLICEIRFPSESVDPLIQRVRDLALHRGKPIPIVVTSTCPLMQLAQQLTVTVEAYLLKPIDLNHFVSKVWSLIYMSSIVSLPSIQTGVTSQHLDKIWTCVAGVS